jgi:hypothetical protein
MSSPIYSLKEVSSRWPRWELLAIEKQLLGYNASISGGEPRGLILGGGFLQLMD